ncbi:MAG: Rrf2 family iron-sulfur cluster assembly transcriptional regulator [Gammaproteobacteria bacterium]|jgi:Rrf2 family iron-sulfur cluster assembly transcriptional regulator
MRLSTKSRYAVTSLLDLVLHADQGPVSLADISLRQGISLSYLEQLFAKMRRNRLVVSTRGPGGGYSLGTTPDQVCIADVISAVDEEMRVTNKDVREGSGYYEPCLTEQLWEELSEQIQSYLTTISLADMVAQEEVKALSRHHDLRQPLSELL